MVSAVPDPVESVSAVDTAHLTGRSNLVGRTDEFTRLARLVDRAAAGRGGVAVILGEPGIGKTALLDAVRQVAGARGMHLQYAAAKELEQQVPFAAIGTCLSVDRTSTDPQTARVYSLLRGDGAPAEGEFNRQLALIEAMLEVVDCRCASGPVAVTMDDVHWADAASLSVLGRLCELIAELPLLVVIALRPLPQRDGIAGLLAQFDAAGADEIRLGPLSRPDVATLVEQTLGAPAGPILADAVTGAGGNPLYVTELVTGLMQADALTDTTGGIREIATPTRGAGAGRNVSLPHSLTETIMRRLDFLPPTARQALAMAAALGAGFEVVELATVVGASVLEMWNAVSVARDAGLIIAAGDELVFRHDLIRQVFADQVPAPTRATLQVQAARRLMSTGAPIDRVANYLLAGEGLMDEACALWLIKNAETLIIRVPELAVELFGQAAAIGGLDSRTQDSLHVRHIRALLWTDRAPEAETMARNALLSRRGAGTPLDTKLRWLLVRAYYGQGKLKETAVAAETALIQPGLTRIERGRFQGFLALANVLSENFEAAVRAAVEAISIGDACDDPISVGFGCNTLGGLRYSQGNLDEALQLAERVAVAYEAAAHLEERREQFDPFVLQTHCLIELDRLGDADNALRFAVQRGKQGRGMHLVSRARLYFLDGRWDDALAEIRAREGLPDIFGHGLVTESMAALIAVRRGAPVPESEEVSVEDRESSSLTYLHFDGWVRALRLEARGLRTDALAELSATCRGMTGLTGSTLYYVYPDLARLAVLTGDRGVAEEVAVAAEQLDARRSTQSRRGTALLCRGLADGRPELLAEAAEEFRSAGRPLYEGQARENLAVLLAQSGRLVEARTALDAALEVYARLDAGWDSARADSRLRDHGLRRGRRGPRGRPKTGWEALTPTESKVAALVAQGHANSEIAAQMFLSRRTIQTHVSSVLGKLGLQSRVQIAVGLRERG